MADLLDDDEQSLARVGSQLNGKWTLERLIGIGGMAAVYDGLHRNGARAAVKVLHPSFARRPDVRARFIREGYAANRVNHSGAVKVLDDDIIEAPAAEEGTPFLVMELLEGVSIEDRIEKGPPISEMELLSIMRAILDVLEVAHKAGVVHRDIKPENLFLAKNPDNPDAPPRIKILDFGLARVQEKGNKTVVGLAIGTPSYMPPEQAAGRVMEIDARSDLFALGASCFRIMAGRTVHPGEDAMDICRQMASEPAPKLRTLAPNVSKGTAAVIDRALEFDRKDRWPNAAAMRDAVDKAIGAMGGQTIAIDSGIIVVSERVEPRHKLKTQISAPDDTPPPAREPSAKLPMKRSWFRPIAWLLVLGAAIVGGKIAYDRYGKTMLANAMDGGILAPIESAVSFDLGSEPDAGAIHDAAPEAHATAPSATPAPTHSAPKRHDAGTKHH